MGVPEISATTQEYIKVRVSLSADGQAADPTGDVVQMAFMATSATPSIGDWKTASWETDATDVSGTVYYARCLVGVDATLSVGRYSVWVKVSDNPEVPVRRAGLLWVY